MAAAQTQRESWEEPFRVFFNHELSFCVEGVLSSTFTTMLNRLQKSSPFSPRPGNNVSSVLLRIMGLDAPRDPIESENLTATLAGRAKMGQIGVTGFWSGCGSASGIAGEGDEIGVGMVTLGDGICRRGGCLLSCGKDAGSRCAMLSLEMTYPGLGAAMFRGGELCWLEAAAAFEVDRFGGVTGGRSGCGLARFT
jgi:hypothetical protein